MIEIEQVPVIEWIERERAGYAKPVGKEGPGETWDCPEPGCEMEHGGLEIFNGDTIYCKTCRTKITFADGYDSHIKTRIIIRGPLPC